MLVNDRMYIWRKPNYMTDYSIFTDFIPDIYIQKLRSERTNRISIYFIDQSESENTLNQITTNHLYHSIEINLDSLRIMN